MERYDSDNRARELARQRIKAKQEFFRHLVFFLIFSVFMVLLNAAVDWGDWWFYWPIMGWGIAVAFHYLDVFGFSLEDERIDRDWQGRTIDRERQPMHYPRRTDDRDSLSEEIELPPLDQPVLRRRKSWDEDEIV